MTLKNTIMSLALGLAGIATAIAGPVDEARKLYRSGDYVAAAELMKPVVKRSPKDGNANFFYGASLFQLGDYVGAEGPLTVAEGRSVAEAAQILAGMSLDRYDVDGAEEHLDKWAAILKKGKKSIPSEHDAMTSRLIRLRNMLDRVECRLHQLLPPLARGRAYPASRRRGAPGELGFRRRAFYRIHA